MDFALAGTSLGDLNCFHYEVRHGEGVAEHETPTMLLGNVCTVSIQAYWCAPPAMHRARRCPSYGPLNFDGRSE